LLAAGLLLVPAFAFQFSGMVPAPQPFLVIVWVFYAVCVLAPLVVDRLLARRVGGFLSTLVFSCAAMGFV
jgi:hypothetical protein